ncbi:hypothetical protein JOM56_012515, partial [Amanita muscaria]
YHNPSPTYGIWPQIDATLINELGHCSTSMDPTSLSPLAVVNVQPNTRYLIRLFSISCYPHFTFSIDNHTMR